MIPRTAAVATLAVLFGVLFALERVRGLRRATQPVRQRVLVNIGFSVLAFAAAALLVRPTAMAVLQRAAESHVGVIYLVAMPATAQLVLAFLLMDLTFYWWHVANHRIAWLWRFHNVHHIDPDLDVTTAFRFHVGEVALSTVFRALQVAAIGLPAWMFAAYELVFQAETMFHHSNVRLPMAAERLMALVIVTPRMHGIHHSHVREETSSNYSVVFSCWDRFHRTLRLNIPQLAITIGVPAYAGRDAHTFVNGLLLPFRDQRDYWLYADGTAADRDAVGPATRRSHLAE